MADIVEELIGGPELAGVIVGDFKGFPNSNRKSAGDFLAGEPSLFGADISWPLMTVRQTSLLNNVEAMGAFCVANGVSLAPHGKTHMSPQLFRLQDRYQTWAVTVATPVQAEIYRRSGANRIVVANEVVNTRFLRWVEREMSSDDGFELMFWVDSEAGVKLADASLSAAERPVKVLVELGQLGGRSGTRCIEDAIAVARSVQASPCLELAGVAGYEGTLGHNRSSQVLDAVDSYLATLFELAAHIDDMGFWSDGIVTAGGSMFFDRVVTGFAESSLRGSMQLVLRPGAYMTHDSGIYASSAFPIPSPLGERYFQAALEVWGEVLSRPEPNLAIVGVGKRDISTDEGFPSVGRGWSHAREKFVFNTADVNHMNDQHALVTISEDEPLDVGDLVSFRPSHPCTTHDKWSLVPIIDENMTIVGLVRSYFL